MAGQPEQRSTLGHLLNVSLPFDKENPVWRLICKGVSELNEEFNPDTDEQQYICDSVKTTILKTYAPSFEISMGYQKDELIQYYFDVMSRKLPIGEKTNIEYIRFNKNETMFNTSDHFVGVRRNANVRFESIGGAGEDYLTSVMTISATGDPEVGYVIVTDTGNGATYTWEKADIDVPFVTSFSYVDSGNTTTVPMGKYYSGLLIKGDVLTVNGKGEPTRKIELKSKEDLSAVDATVDAVGNWSMPITISGSGLKIFSFLQKDPSNSNKSVTTKVYSVTLSATPTPTTPTPYVIKIGTNNASSVTEETTIQGESFAVTGSGDPGNTISLAESHSQFLSASPTTTTVDANGSWSLTINIAQNTDSIGNFSIVQINNNISSLPTKTYSAKFKRTQS